MEKVLTRADDVLVLEAILAESKLWPINYASLSPWFLCFSSGEPVQEQNLFMLTLVKRKKRRNMKGQGNLQGSFEA